MENLLNYYKGEVEDCVNFGNGCMESGCDCIDAQTLLALKELKAYRDAEEQGLLLRLPCKVGDKVYADSNCFGVLEYEVDEIIINGGKITFLCSAYSTPIGDCPSECLDEIEPDITDFGKLVFLTKEEAEQKQGH